MEEHACTHTCTLHSFLSTTWPDKTRPSTNITPLLLVHSMHTQSVLATTVLTSWDRIAPGPITDARG